VLHPLIPLKVSYLASKDAGFATKSHTRHCSQSAGDGNKSLDDLPNEILLQIFSYVDLHRCSRILGYIPDDPPPSPPDAYLIEDFRVIQHDLNNIALTCKRFTPLVQEALMFAPVLEANSSPANLAHSDVLGLILKFCAKPELARHVKQLRMHLPPVDSISPPDNILEDLRIVIASSRLPQPWRETWSNRLDDGRTCAEALLALLPQLRRLCISEPNSHLGIEWIEGSPISYLKVETPLPPYLAGLNNLPYLHTLDLSLRTQGEPSHMVVVRSIENFTMHPPQDPSLFYNIYHLRLDFDVRTVGVWNAATIRCMSNVVRAFKNLKTLEYYAESSESKNPYRSVRAFPAYQANIQNYPDVSLPVASDVANERYWDRAIYNARTQVTDYQNLVDGFVHLRSKLERLQLPGGFWTLPGAVRKPIPRFDQFTQLKALIVPLAAIVSIKLDNMRFDTVSDNGDFELSPSLALPRSLQYLKIFDVDAGFLESVWLQELFREQRDHRLWPELRCMEILLGATYSDDELERLLARRSGESFWKMVDGMSFNVVVGRDVEGPEVVVEHYDVG
jgi:hypothetical protein